MHADDFSSSVWKFTEEVEVCGTFDTFVLDVKNETGSVENLMKNAKMNIITSSVNSDDEIRDPKLRVSIFKVFKTDTIFGEIVDAKKGECDLKLKMNNISNVVQYDYSLKNDTRFLTWSRSVNLVEQRIL